LSKLDNNLKIKIEHEISRIEKQITDAKPLLALCIIEEPDFVEITATAQILHSFYNGVESVIILFLKIAVKTYQTIFIGINLYLKWSLESTQRK
jgi:hypothetical protein